MKTSAGVHLLDVSDRALRVRSIRGQHKKGNELVERQSGTKVLSFSVSFDRSNHSLKVTLLADTFPRDRVQSLGIHDGIVDAVDRFVIFPSLDVKLSRPMTTFTANSVALENRNPEMIERAVNRLGILWKGDEVMRSLFLQAPITIP